MSCERFCALEFGQVPRLGGPGLASAKACSVNRASKFCILPQNHLNTMSHHLLSPQNDAAFKRLFGTETYKPDHTGMLPDFRPEAHVR